MTALVPQHLAWSDTGEIESDTATLAEAGARWRQPLPAEIAIDFVPITEGELLGAARRLPIAVRRSASGLAVGVVAASGYLPAARVDVPAWSGLYAPHALRHLPFALRPDGTIGVLSRWTSEEDGQPVRTEEGAPSEAITSIVSALTRWRLGLERLVASAEHLLAADLLCPFLPVLTETAPDEATYYTLAKTRFDAMTPFRAAALARRDIGTIELAGALRFAQGLSTAMAIEATANEPTNDHGPRETPSYTDRRIPLTLDGGELIDAERFET